MENLKLIFWMTVLARENISFTVQISPSGVFRRIIPQSSHSSLYNYYRYYDLHSSPNNFRAIQKRRLRWAMHLARIGKV